MSYTKNIYEFKNAIEVEERHTYTVSYTHLKEWDDKYENKT